jgi:hypothetical protein
MLWWCGRGGWFAQLDRTRGEGLATRYPGRRLLRLDTLGDLAKTATWHVATVHLTGIVCIWYGVLHIETVRASSCATT